MFKFQRFTPITDIKHRAKSDRTFIFMDDSLIIADDVWFIKHQRHLVPWICLLSNFLVLFILFGPIQCNVRGTISVQVS